MNLYYATRLIFIRCLDDKTQREHSSLLVDLVEGEKVDKQGLERIAGKVYAIAMPSD